MNHELIRIGVGTDVHRLADGVPMHLAGLAWPDEPQGLEGHSDADVAAHAACDALLSAAGLGDLGSTLRHGGAAVGGRVGSRCWPRPPGGSEAGCEIGNVAVQVIGNRPRLGPRRAEAEAALGRGRSPVRCRPRPPTGWASPAAARASPRSRPPWCHRERAECRDGRPDHAVGDRTS